MAFYGDSCSSFLSPLKLGPGTFVATSKDGSFKDHDDTNLSVARRRAGEGERCVERLGEKMAV